MMERQGKVRRLVQAAASLSMAGVLLGTSCSNNDVRAVVAGIGAAADQLDQGNRITFGEFITSQLDR